MHSFKSLTDEKGHSTGGFELQSGVKLAAAALIFAIMAGCGGKPFNVRERPFNVREGAKKPPAGYDARAESGSATIQAQVIRDEDFLFDTFDANLILAGVLPIEAMITNSGQEALDLKRARFEVRTQEGRKYKSADAKRAFKQLISYYGISTYSKSGYKESQEDFASYSLDTSSPLAPGQSRDGMLFFLVPVEVAQGAPVVLVASRLGGKRSEGNEAVELMLK